MSKQMEALLMLANYRSIKDILMPIVDPEKEEIHWDRLEYGVLSGGQKAAISWAWCIWNDRQTPVENKHDDPNYCIFDGKPRDPFEGFGVMDRELQALIAKALLHRYSA
jgi:hypothetical protein